jgi:tetratricopeptide (TPR) repeat protein
LRQEGDVTCAICWKNLPKKPQALPCAHEFCKGCILDLTNHAKSVKATPSCPICRGPVEKESIKTLWKQAADHERTGKMLLGLGAMPSSRSNVADFSLSFLTTAAVREYGLAATKLEESLVLLDAEALTSTSSKETMKWTQKKVTVLMKLQTILKFQSETQDERRLELLQKAMELSTKPLPEAHLDMGKILRLGRGNKNCNLDLAVAEYQTILKLAEQSRLTIGVGSAKNLRGKAHFNLGICYQLDGKMAQAAEEYDLAHKYKSCKDYALAAKCHSVSGNLPKAIGYGKKALKHEESDPLCDTYLIMIAIYEKFFLLEQLEGNLSEAQNYKHAAGIEHYCECLARTKELAQDLGHRGEVFVRLESLMRLIPWKRESMQSHFPSAWLAIASSSRCHMGRSSTIESRSTDTFDSAESSTCLQHDEDDTHDSTDSFEMQDHEEEEESSDEEEEAELETDDDIDAETEHESVTESSQEEGESNDVEF